MAEELLDDLLRDDIIDKGYVGQMFPKASTSVTLTKMTLDTQYIHIRGARARESQDTIWKA